MLQAENWTNYWPGKAANWKLVSGGLLWGYMLEALLVSIFSNDLDDATVCTLRAYSRVYP